MEDNSRSTAQRVREAADRLERARDLGERAAVARELQECVAALHGELADLQPPVPPSEPGGPVHSASTLTAGRGDRVVAIGGREVPVWAFVGEPLEFLGMRVDDVSTPDHPSLGVELHNPSREAYRAHGKLVFQDVDGERLGRREFSIEAIDPFETVTQADLVELPDDAAAISIVVSVDLAG